MPIFALPERDNGHECDKTAPIANLPGSHRWTTACGGFSPCLRLNPRCHFFLEPIQEILRLQLGCLKLMDLKGLRNETAAVQLPCQVPSFAIRALLVREAAEEPLQLPPSDHAGKQKHMSPL